SRPENRAEVLFPGRRRARHEACKRSSQQPKYSTPLSPEGGPGGSRRQPAVKNKRDGSLCCRRRAPVKKSYSQVRRARSGDWKALAGMRAELWPESSIEEHARELKVILGGAEQGNAAMLIFVWEEGDGELTGFAETRLRSHADGCDESRPVGYLEGWFVRKEQRRKGIGAHLLGAAENWAREQGCREMASDAEITNHVSQRAHEALGFQPGSRVVTYRKSL